MSKDNCGCLQILKKDEIISSELELKINETYTIGTHSRNDIRLKVQTLVPEYSIIDTKHNGLVAFSSHNVIDCKINDIPFKGIKYLEPGDIVSIMGKRFRYDKSFFTEKDFKMIQSKNKNLCSKQLLKIKINRRRTMMVKNNVNKTSVSMKGSMTPMPKRGRNIYSQFLEEDIENHPVTPSRNNTISVSTPRMKKVFNTPLSIGRNKNRKASSFLHYQPIDLEIGNSSSSSRFFGRSKENDGSVSDSFDDGEAPPRSQATLLEDVTDPGLVDDDDDEGGESSARAKLKVFSEISPNNLSWRKRSLNNTNTPQLIESTPLNIRMRSSVKQSRERKSRDIAVSHLPIFKNNEFVTQRKSQKITHAPNSRYKSSTSDESDVDAADVITDVNEASTANILKHQSEHSEVAASNSDYLSDTFEFDGVSSGEEMFKPKIRNEDEPSEANCGVKRTRRETKSLDNASLRKSKKAKRARSNTVRLKRRDIFRVDKNNITDVKEEISELLNTSEDAPSTHLHELSDLEGIQQLSGSTCITDNSNNSLDDQDESIIAHQTRATPQNNSRSPIRSSLRLFETSSVHKVSPQDNLKAIKSSSGLRNTSKVEESPQNVMQTTRSSIGLFKTPKPVESPRVHFNIILSTPGITQNPFKDATDNKEASVDAGDVEDVATKTPKFEKLSAKRSRKSNRITSTPKIEESPQSISKVVRRTTKNNYATRSSFGSYVDIEKTPKFEKSPTKSLRKSGNTTGATVAPEIEESSQNISKEVRKTPKMSYPTSNLFSSYVDIEKIATPEVKRSSKVGLRSNVSSAQKLSNTSKIGSFVAEDLTDFSDVEDVATKSPKFEKSPAKSLRKSRITAGATPKIEESSQSISKEERRTPKINYRSRNSSSSYVDIENIAATPEVKRSSGAGLRGNTSSAQKFLETSTIGNFAAEDLTDVSDVEDDATQSPKFEKSPAKSLRKSRNIGAAPATPNIEESPQSISKEERTSKISYRSRNSSNSYVNIEKIAATPEVKRSSGAGLRGNTSSAQKFLETSTIGNFAAEDLTDVSDVEDDATKSPKFEKSPAKSLRKSRIIARAAATPKIEEFSQSISTEERTPNISCRSRNSSNSYVHIEKIAATPEVKRSSGVGLRGNTSSAQKLLDTSTIGNFAAEDSTDASDIEDVATKTPKFEKSASKSSRMSGNIAAATSKIEESPQSISKAVSRTSKISYRSRNSSNSYVHIENIATTPEVKRSSGAGLRANTSSAQKFLDTSNIGNFADENSTDASDVGDVATKTPKLEKSASKSSRKSGNIAATSKIEESPQSISKAVSRTSKISSRTRNLSVSFVDIEKIAGTPEVRILSETGLRGNTSSPQKLPDTSKIGNFSDKDWTDASDVENVTMKSPKFEKVPAKSLRKSRNIAGAVETPKIEEFPQNISKAERRTPKIGYRTMNSSSSYVDIEKIAATPEVERSSPTKSRGSIRSAQKLPNISKIGNFDLANDSDVENVAIKTPKFEKTPNKSSRKSGNIAATPKSLRKSRNIAGAIGTSNVEGSPQSISKAVSRTSKISSRTRNSSGNYVDIENIAATPEAKISSEAELRGNISNAQKLPDTSTIGSFAGEDLNDASDIENVAMKSPKLKKSPAKSLRKSRNIAAAPATPNIEESPQNTSKTVTTPKISYCTRNSFDTITPPDVNSSSEVGLSDSIRGAQELSSTPKNGNFADEDLNNASAVKEVAMEKSLAKDSRNSIRNRTVTPKIEETQKSLTVTRSSSRFLRTPLADESSESNAFRTAKIVASKYSIGDYEENVSNDDLSDVRDENISRLLRTPKEQKPPINDLSDVRGLKKLFATPRVQKLPTNNLSDLRGVKTLLGSQKKQNQPVNDLSTIVGVKKLFTTPKPQRSPKNDLTDVRGVKKLMSTPKIQKQPDNDLSDLRGVRKLLGSQKKQQKPPVNELSHFVGVKEMFSIAKPPQKAPKNDLSDVEGVKRLLKTPKQQKLPRNDLTNVGGVKKIMATPKLQKPPKNDLTNLSGVKDLFSGYEDETSNDLKLQKTGGDAIDVTEVNFENEENCIADMKKPTPIRAKKQPNKSMDIRSTDEVEDIKVDPFDALTNRKAIRTYKKSTSPRKNPVTEQELSSLVTEWVEGQNKRLGDELTKSSIANTSSDEGTANERFRTLNDQKKRLLTQTRRNKEDVLGQVEKADVSTSGLEEMTESNVHSPPDLRKRPLRQTRRNKRDILGGAKQTGESKSGLEEITVEPTSQSTPDLHKRPLRQTRRNKAEMPKTEKIEDDKASTTAKGGAQRRGKTRNKDENAVINENREENRTIDEQEDDLVTVKPVRGGRKIARQLKSQSNTHVNVDETEKKSDSDHDDVVAKYEGRPVRTRRKRVLYSPDAEYAPPTIQIADEVRHKSEDSKKLPAKRGRRNVNSLKLLEEDAGNNEIKSPNTSKQEQKPAVKRTSRKRKSESDPTTSEVNEEEPQIRRSKRTRK